MRLASTYDGRASTARPWLYGILARLLQERRRSLARLARALLRVGSAPNDTFAAPTSAQRDLERGLRSLTEEKRITLLLAEVEGYTCEEIAEMLGVPVGTVWTRLHRARRDLRKFYGEALDDP
jgi:RNA polymerase sigma-70 factor (ECF subfamily)